LTEDGGTRALLLEAGGWDRGPWLTILLAWGRILRRRVHDWVYFAEPEATLDGRGIECARGEVIGSSSIRSRGRHHHSAALGGEPPFGPTDKRTARSTVSGHSMMRCGYRNGDSVALCWSTLQMT
jgi:hypothetical protein